MCLKSQKTAPLGAVDLEAVVVLFADRDAARQGQQRSLRRMCQFLSWAFARSPGARSAARARMAAISDSGLFLPFFGTFAYFDLCLP